MLPKLKSASGYTYTDYVSWGDDDRYELVDPEGRNVTSPSSC